GVADSITTITIVTPGVGYSSTPTITISAPASGNTATAVATVGYNGITAITLSTGGRGQLSAPQVVLARPVGSRACATAFWMLSGGVMRGVTITNPGHNYQGAVGTFVGGRPAVAAATIELMPKGGQNPVGGSAIEVFKNRVWMVNNTIRFTSAVGDLANFSAS